MCVLRKIIWCTANVSLLITRSNQYFLGCIPDSLDLIDDDSCVSIKYLNYWSSEMSSVTIKSRIKSISCFICTFLTRVHPRPELLERERPLSRTLTSCYEASGSHPNFAAQSVHLHFCTGMSDIPLYVSLVELVFACSKYIGRIPRHHSIHVHKRSHWRTRWNRKEEIQILHPHPLTTKLPLLE